MKKISAIILFITAGHAANAQNSEHFNEMVFNAVAVIFVFLAIMVFIITVLKRVLDHRLKNKIIDKGIAENIASSILQSDTKDEGNINIKWFALLAGTGAGLGIVNFTQPLGIHSLAIMCACISVSFLGYYFFQQRTKK